ncbi:metallophosphoesterase [Candidatus Dependentiae bacterium]
MSIKIKITLYLIVYFCVISFYFAKNQKNVIGYENKINASKITSRSLENKKTRIAFYDMSWRMFLSYKSGWDNFFLQVSGYYLREIYKFYNQNSESLGNEINFGEDDFFSKLIVPKDSSCFIFGDLHADFHGLSKIIISLQRGNVLDSNLILSKGSYLFFLGDYIDRGSDNFKVLSLLMLLWLKNPGYVILLKGNHESKFKNKGPYFEYYGKKCKHFGLYSEITKKYCDNSRKYKILKKAFLSFSNSLPLACFLGKIQKNKIINFLILSHAAFDIRLDYRILLNFEGKDKNSLKLCSINNRDLLISNNLKDWLLKLSLEKNSDIFFEDIIWEQNLLEFIFMRDYFSPKKDSFYWTDIALKSGKDFFWGERGLNYSLFLINFFLDNYASLKNKYYTRTFIHGHQHDLPFLMNKVMNVGISIFSIDNFNFITLISGTFPISYKPILRYFPSFICIKNFNKSPDCFVIKPLLF